MKTIDAIFQLVFVAMILWMIFGDPSIGFIFAAFFAVLLKIEINIARALREDG